MTELHLEIDAAGRAAFRAEAPEVAGGPAVPLRGDALRTAVREVVWYADGFEEDEADDARLWPSGPNLLMFLSDVRGRRFKSGVFLGADVLAAAELFRRAAKIVAAGRYLPTLVQEGAAAFARWQPVVWPCDGGASGREARFLARCLDGLVRRARRTALEDDAGGHETVHDAWMAALRSETGRIRWEGGDDLASLARDLAAWRSPLVVSAADRAALRLTPVAPATPISSPAARRSPAFTHGSFARWAQSTHRPLSHI